MIKPNPKNGGSRGFGILKWPSLLQVKASKINVAFPPDPNCSLLKHLKLI